MSHELDVRLNADGEAIGDAMFYVKRGGTPWHRLGEAFDSAPTLPEALEAAGHDFEVEKKEIYHIHPTQPGFLKIDGSYATVRTDRNEALGIVSDRYSVLQNRDAFAVLEPMMESGLVTLETGGTLRGGQDVWMLAKFNEDGISAQHNVGDLFDEIQPYGLIWNNHSGRSTVMLMETPVRVVCANTLAIALRKGASHSARVRHTGNVADNIKLAADIVFGRVAQRFELFALQRELLKMVRINEVEFVTLVSEPVVRCHKFEKAWQNRLRKFGADDSRTSRAEKAYERQVNREVRLTELWRAGDGHTGDQSAWEAFNGLTQALDHDPLFQRNSRTQAARLRRQQETVKTETLHRLLRFSGENAGTITPPMANMLAELR